jgi:hypothetical protein
MSSESKPESEWGKHIDKGPGATHYKGDDCDPAESEKCPECDGTGKLFGSVEDRTAGEILGECRACNGTGRVTPAPLPPEQPLEHTCWGKDCPLHPAQPLAGDDIATNWELVCTNCTGMGHTWQNCPDTQNHIEDMSNMEIMAPATPSAESTAAKPNTEGELDTEDVELEKLVYESRFYQDNDEVETGLWVPEADMTEFVGSLEAYIADQIATAHRKGQIEALEDLLTMLNNQEEYQPEPSKALKWPNSLILRRLDQLKSTEAE